MWAAVERLLALIVIGAVLWTALRSHPFFSIPLQWRWLGVRDPVIAEALRLRSVILQLLGDGRARHADLLIADIDELLGSMSELVQVRLALVGTHGADSPRLKQAVDRTEATLQGARRRLEDLKATLLEQAAVDAEASVEEARVRFRERAEDFGFTVAAQAELKAELEAMQRPR